MYSTFAIRWLIPRLPAFQRAHPGVNVRLHTSQSDVNFEYEDVDACVMIGHPACAGLRYDFLFSSRVFPVCSPATLAEHRLRDDPARLREAPLLQVYPSRIDWWTWLDANRVDGVDPDAGQQFDSYELAMNAAVQGIGVALGIEPFVMRDLRSEALVEPFPGRRSYTAGDWYLVCRDSKSTRPDIETFRDGCWRRRPATRPCLRLVRVEFQAGGRIVEDERDAVVGAAIHDAVHLLVVDLVGLADFHAARPAVDREAHARVGGDRHVDAVPGGE